MKTYCLLFALLFSFAVSAQQKNTLIHGTIFGTKPNQTAMLNADKLEAFMGKKTRISTTLKGKVIKVTKQKGGWFDIDGGNGKVIAAHFKNYNISIPADLKDHAVIVEGVAQKQFIADDQQHFAGDTVKGKKHHSIKTDTNRKLTFEVTGLMVD
jgi:hypothetical protein